MTMETKLHAQTREASGSAVSRRLRRDGWIPGIINNKKCESRMVQVIRHDFDLLRRHQGGGNLILDLEVDKDEPKKVLLKNVQIDPLTGAVLHADFLEISMTEKMRAHIPVSLTGEPVGVSQEGGILDHLLREIEVECLPMDIVKHIEVDVSALKIGDTISVDDVTVDPKLTVLTASDMVVASVSAPRKEEEPVPEEAAEGAKPEVIGAAEEEEDREKDKGEKTDASAEATARQKDKGQKTDGKKKKSTEK